MVVWIGENHGFKFNSKHSTQVRGIPDRCYQLVCVCVLSVFTSNLLLRMFPTLESYSWVNPQLSDAFFPIEPEASFGQQERNTQ